MPKRISKKSKPRKKTTERKDSNQNAFATLQKTIEASEADEPQLDKATVSAVMAALGRIGGRRGGKRRMETMTTDERRQNALLAARARWAKKREAKD